MKQRLRPQMSVSLLPGIISAAMVRVNSVMAVCTPTTVVPMSSAMVLIATFMLRAGVAGDELRQREGQHDRAGSKPGPRRR